MAVASKSSIAPVVTGDGLRGLSGARRQARWRERQRLSGIAAITIMVPSAAGADLHLLAEAMRAAPHLRPGPLRDPVSGKLVSAKAVLAKGARAAVVVGAVQALDEDEKGTHLVSTAGATT